ncbi:MAG TPA: hypothetical protein PKA06_10735 [Gemmatales bacterium]|nr:hypothetical protein [Gemmatales bacterium]
MTMQLHATDLITRCDGIPCRVWEGVTEGGVRCKVFVHHLAASDRHETHYLEQELHESLPISRLVKLTDVQ